MEQLILLVKYQTKPNKRKDFVKKVISSGVLEKNTSRRRLYIL